MQDQKDIVTSNAPMMNFATTIYTLWVQNTANNATNGNTNALASSVYLRNTSNKER